MNKNIFALVGFAIGSVAGFSAGYLYWRSKRKAYERACDQVLEKELESLRKAFRPKIANINEIVSTDDELKRLRQEDKIIPLDRTLLKNHKKIDYTKFSEKPNLDDLAAEIDSEKIMVNDPGSIYPYQIVDVDTELPDGYESETLYYHMIDDILVNDESAIFHDPEDLLGEEVYELCKSDEGVVYLINHKEKLLMEITSTHEEFHIPERIEGPTFRDPIIT